jgi:hypothetical protein
MLDEDTWALKFSNALNRAPDVALIDDGGVTAVFAHSAHVAISFFAWHSHARH